MLQGVVKSQGRIHGEPIEPLCVIRVETVTFEPLKDIGKDPLYAIQELVWEGFPNLTPDEFIAMFCKSHKGCTPDTQITRVFFDYEPD